MNCFRLVRFVAAASIGISLATTHGFAQPTSNKILVVLSASDFIYLADDTPHTTSDNTKYPTGWFLREAGEPIEYMLNQGYQLSDFEVATPHDLNGDLALGKQPPIDTNSLELPWQTYPNMNELAVAPLRRQKWIEIMQELLGQLKFGDKKKYIGKDQELESPEVTKFVKDSQKTQSNRRPKQLPSLAQMAYDLINGNKNYDGLLIPGGHSPVLDLIDDPYLALIMYHFHKQMSPMAIICHAPIVMLNTQYDNMDRLEELMKGNELPPHSKVVATWKQIKAQQAPAVQGATGWMKDYPVTGATTAEENFIELFGPIDGEKVLTYVDEALMDAGFKVHRNAIPGFPHLVMHKELMTAQNPATAPWMAMAFMESLALQKEGENWWQGRKLSAPQSIFEAHDENYDRVARLIRTSGGVNQFFNRIGDFLRIGGNNGPDLDNFNGLSNFIGQVTQWVSGREFNRIEFIPLSQDVYLEVKWLRLPGSDLPIYYVGAPRRVSYQDSVKQLRRSTYKPDQSYPKLEGQSDFGSFFAANSARILDRVTNGRFSRSVIERVARNQNLAEAQMKSIIDSSDFRLEGETKRLHPVGVCAEATWEMNDHGEDYTGVFQANTKIPAIVRLSVGGNNLSRFRHLGFYRMFGIGIKLFPGKNTQSTKKTVNFLFFDNFGPDGNPNASFVHSPKQFFSNWMFSSPDSLPFLVRTGLGEGFEALFKQRWERLEKQIATYTDVRPSVIPEGRITPVNFGAVISSEGDVITERVSSPKFIKLTTDSSTPQVEITREIGGDFRKEIEAIKKTGKSITFNVDLRGSDTDSNQLKNGIAGRHGKLVLKPNTFRSVDCDFNLRFQHQSADLVY